MRVGEEDRGRETAEGPRRERRRAENNGPRTTDGRPYALERHAPGWAGALPMPRALLFALLALAACRPSAAPPAAPPGPAAPEAAPTAAAASPALDSLLRVYQDTTLAPCADADPAGDYRAMTADSTRDPGALFVPLGEPVTLAIGPGAPTATVQAVGPEEDGSPRPMQALRVTWAGAGSPLQTLALEAPFYPESRPEALDVNGDGYGDLRFTYRSGAGYTSDYVWLYRPSERRFVGGLYFPGELQVDAATGAVTSAWRIGCCERGLNQYAFQGERPVVARQWVTVPAAVPEEEVTAVCRRDGDALTVEAVRPGMDWSDAPGQE